LNREIKEKLINANITLKSSPSQRAFLYLKILGNHKILVFDQSLFQGMNIGENRKSGDHLQTPAKLETFYLGDAYGMDFFSKTITGFPVHLVNHNSLALYAHQDILSSKSLMKSKNAIKFKHERHVAAEIISPLTEQVHSSGVTASSKILTSFKAQFHLRQGHFHAYLMPLQKPEGNSTGDIFSFIVKPYTSLQTGATYEEGSTKLIKDNRFPTFNVSSFLLQ
jgi:hypothetical protein